VPNIIRSKVWKTRFGYKWNMKKMAVRKYYGHFQKPTSGIGYTKIQEFINRTAQVNIVAMNIFFVKKNRK